MIEGKLYLNKNTGGLYECHNSIDNIAVMHRITMGYEGRDEARVAVFLDEEEVNDWELASNEELDFQIVQNNRGIRNAESQIKFWKKVIRELEATSTSIETKKGIK